MKEQNEQLKDFAKLLQNEGFEVIVSATHPFEWLYFERDGKLGSVSPSYYGGFNFATVHKPCSEHGTGYQIIQDSELTIQNAEDSLAYAGWGNPTLNKYKNAQDFIDNNAWAKYYILPKEHEAVLAG